MNGKRGPFVERMLAALLPGLVLTLIYIPWTGSRDAGDIAVM